MIHNYLTHYNQSAG